MRVKVTRHFSVTTEHDITDGLEAGKFDVALSVAAEDSAHAVVETVRAMASVHEAGCLDTPEPRFEIVFPTRKGKETT